MRQRLLTRGATHANPRGEYTRASYYLNEMERYRPVVAAPVQEPLPRGGTLVAPLALPLAHKHPASMRTTDEGEIAGCVFECLLRTDEKGRLVPELCTTWEESASGSCFVFTLRSGVRVHDGELLTAALVKRSMEEAIRLTRDRLPLAYSPILGVQEFLEKPELGISGLEARDEHTLAITLR